MECFCAVVDALVLLVTGYNCMTRSSALNYTGEDIERRPRTMEANRRARSYGNYTNEPVPERFRSRAAVDGTFPTVSLRPGGKK